MSNVPRVLGDETQPTLRSTLVSFCCSLGRSDAVYGAATTMSQVFRMQMTIVKKKVIQYHTNCIQDI